MMLLLVAVVCPFITAAKYGMHSARLLFILLRTLYPSPTIPSQSYLMVTAGGLLFRISSISAMISGVSFLYARTASMFS